MARCATGRDPDALLISSSGLMVVGRDDAEYRRRLTETAEALNQAPGGLEQGFRDRDAPHGTAAQARDRLGTLAASGVARFYVQSVGGTTPGEFEELLGLAGGLPPPG